MKNPTSQLAREIIANGEIGEVVHFYGTHNEIIWPDPGARRLTGTAAAPAPGWVRWEIWRRIIINMAHSSGGRYRGGLRRYADRDRKQRPDPRPGAPAAGGKRRSGQRVAAFRRRGDGHLKPSRIACGRKMGLTYVVTGTKGTLSYTLERRS